MVSPDFQNKPQAFRGVPGLVFRNTPADVTQMCVETIPDPSASLKTHIMCPAVLYPHF